jgi:hypothetical protein
MKRPYGKSLLAVVLAPILLVTGAVLLRSHLKQEMPANITSRMTEAHKQSGDSGDEYHKKEKQQLVKIPATPTNPGQSSNSLLPSEPKAESAQASVGPATGLPVPPPGRRARRGSVEQAVERVWAAPNPDAQIAALRELANYQDPQTLPQIMEVVGPAFHSQVAGVRKVALEVMRDVTVDDPAMLADVRSAVTYDPDPEVQYAALEVLVRYDESPEARRLLEELVADPKGVYRDYALQELERLDYEADARTRPDPQLQQVKAVQ